MERKTKSSFLQKTDWEDFEAESIKVTKLDDNKWTYYNCIINNCESYIKCNFVWCNMYEIVTKQLMIKLICYSSYSNNIINIINCLLLWFNK